MCRHTPKRDKKFCKKCYNKAWYKKNAKRIKTSGKLWRKKNAERLKISKKAWRKKNAKRIKAQRNVWRKKNAKRIKAQYSLWRKKNAEKLRLWRKIRYQKNRKKILKNYQELRKQPGYLKRMAAKSRKWQKKNIIKVRLYRVRQRIIKQFPKAPTAAVEVLVMASIIRRRVAKFKFCPHVKSDSYGYCGACRSKKYYAKHREARKLYFRSKAVRLRNRIATAAYRRRHPDRVKRYYKHRRQLLRKESFNKGIKCQKTRLTKS